MPGGRRPSLGGGKPAARGDGQVRFNPAEQGRLQGRLSRQARVQEAAGDLKRPQECGLGGRPERAGEERGLSPEDSGATEAVSREAAESDPSSGDSGRLWTAECWARDSGAKGPKREAGVRCTGWGEVPSGERSRW